MSSIYFQVAPDVWGIKDILVNVYLVRNPQDGTWVLIDTGLKSAGKKIKKMAADLFGPNSRPTAILLTHGHFDHIGSVKELAQEWNVPVYAHHLEMPYLTEKSDYPPPDPTVGGGLMANLSWMFPKSPIDIHDKLQELPHDGSLPFLPGWKSIHTPGHAPGHVAFFREKDRLLISGDAIVTTKQESAFYVMLQKKKLSGPPKYFTYDWQESKDSFQKLTQLEPQIIATGHGKPMSGEPMKNELANLATHFDELAVPKQGRYVDHPAVADETGVTYVPPRKRSITLLVTIVLFIIILLLLFMFER